MKEPALAHRKHQPSPSFPAARKASHLSGQHPLVLLLLEEVRRVAHVVAVHQVVGVVHADRVHGKPAGEKSESTHRRHVVQSMYRSFSCLISIFSTDLWEFSLGQYERRLLVPRGGLKRAELCPSSPFPTSWAHGCDGPGLEATGIWNFGLEQTLF